MTEKNTEFITLKKSDYLDAIPELLAECNDILLMEFIYHLLSKTMKG